MRHPLLRHASVAALLVALALTVGSAASVILTFPASNPSQERSQWCWAGTSQAILKYYGTTVSQCTIANYASGYPGVAGRPDCCVPAGFSDNDSVLSGCNYWNYMWGSSAWGVSNGSLQGILSHWGVASTTSSTYMSRTAIETQLAAGRPAVMRFGWTGGGGHFLDLYGQEENALYLDYWDPWPGNGATRSSHAWVVSAPDHDWTHTLILTTAAPASQPAIAQVVPSSGPTAGGTVITITGTGFVSGAVVSVGGVAASAVSHDGNTVMVATTAPHAAGAVDVVVTNPGGLAATKASGFTYSATPVTLTATPRALRFGTTKAGASSGTLVYSTPAQNVDVTQAGPATAWTATTTQAWLLVTNGVGSGSGRFTVSITNPRNVIGGAATLAGAITLTSATSAPVSVPVILTIDQTGGTATAAPFGLVDTPAQNATNVQGTIGVTGWALDDIGVSSVKVYRNCLAFEPQTNCALVAGRPGMVYVGDATIVAGARPDVEGIYATQPQAHRAAWGYLLLTNLLPHVPNGLMFGGQGALAFSMLATDIEGKQVWLGRTLGDTTATTITMANATIAKPFGAIDTPAQGATVSGAFWNFGWALTPDANTTAGDAGDIFMPPSGGSMQVYVDGIPLGTPTYDMCRGTTPTPVFCDDDIASIFGHPTPQPFYTVRSSNPTAHRNLDAGRGAIGARFVDTSTLANGIHTIVWGVVDSAGRGEGIGSRYFTVLNTGIRPSIEDSPDESDGAVALPRRTDRLTASRELSGPIGSGAAALAALPAADAPVRARTGFDLDAPLVDLAAGEDGVRVLCVPPLGRLELTMGPVEDGYLVANNALRTLPAGSNLDRASGTFTWNPGVGFQGTYELVFVRDGARIPVIVTIRPTDIATPGMAQIRLHLDAPRPGDNVGSAFMVAGWALDPQADIGSGIGSVHVWAQRTDTPAAPPIFLGAAALGLARPDVAIVHGAIGGRSGFALMSGPLPAGTYDVTAYVWTRRTARWEDARTATIRVK